jgi:Protein of unknown function (DUF1501)
LEDSIRNDQRTTGMTSGQASFPIAAPIFKFQQAGKSGTWISELLPHTAKIVDDIAIFP